MNYDKVVFDLRGERELVQKKTFQKWVNSHLVRCSCRIGDLYVDLRDGKMLIRLLEILSGERLPRPTKGKMRIHCLENVDKALQFLREQRVHLENMGSHDIVDGNPRLSLGLIWTIILRFQIQDITIEETDNQETKSAKDALLLWCQMKTAGYHNVNVRNFTTSWRDGLAFNAIIHKHRPDLIQFDKLSKSNAIYNLNNAFNVAEDKLGLTKLLDAEDIFVDHPDEKSIITYVVTYYHYFSKMKQETVQGKRIGKVVGIAMENDRMIHEYESLTSDLLRWIEATIEALGDRRFANSLVGVQSQLSQFSNYRTVEKPPKFVEKGNLEVLLFTLQSKMRANNQKPYTPKEGKMISDINKAWERLEKAEHERELALREELIRQEKLEQLAARFNRKASMRETWLSENQRLVSQDNFGFDLAAVEAAAKKHEAIETDIFAYEERVQAVMAVSQELEAENYHDIERINARKDNVLRLWNYLLELLRARRMRLELSLQLQQNFQEKLYILDSMEEIKMRLLTDDYGKHLMGVEDLLQKHSLVEADINVLGERVKAVVQQSQKFLEHGEGYRPCDPAIIVERVQQLENAYAELFYWDMADEENWIKEKEQIVSTGDIGHDLTTINLLLSKHKALENEIQSHEPQLMSVAAVGDELVRQQHFGSDRIQERLQEILGMWNHLLDLAAFRRKRLEEAVDYHQLFADADDIDIWMLDTLRLVSSEDVGRDEANQASTLGEQDAKSPEVLERLTSIDNSETDGVEQWIGEKNRMLDTMVPVKDIEDVEIMKHRYNGFEKEMNANASRVAVKWAELREKAEGKREELNSAHGVQTFHIECRETVSWIEDKKRILQQTDSLEMDLTGVMTLQRRLSGMERDLAAIQAKLDALEKEAEVIQKEHPEEAAVIRDRIAQIHLIWEQLTQMLKERDAKLEEAGDLHREDTPTSLADAEKLLTQHQNIKEEIDNYTDDYQKMMEYGERLTTEAGDGDTQYMFLRERLNALKMGWEELHQMWEHILTKDETPANFEQAEHMIKRHEAFMTTMDANDEKINSVVQFAGRLVDEGHFAADKVKKKAENINERRRVNREKANQLMEKLKDQLQLQMFLQDCEELGEWVQEKHITAQDETYRSAKTIHSKWTRHQAFEAEIASNKDRLQQLQQAADELIQQKPDLAEIIKPKVAELADQFVDLETTTHDKEKQIESTDTGSDLASVNILMQKQQMIETQMAVKAKQVTELDKQAQHLQRTVPDDKMEEIKCKKEKVAQRFAQLKAPLIDRQRHLEKKKEAFQFRRDVEDEKLWIAEKMPQATSTEYGNSLFNVHMLKKKNQSLRTEIDNHEPRINLVCNNGQKLIDEGHEDSPEFQKLISELTEKWRELKDAVDDRNRHLLQNEKAQQYFFDATEAESWMSEQELYMMVEDRGKDEISAQNLMKKHESLEHAIAVKQSQADKLYAGLKDLAGERRAKLDEALQLFMLNREVDDLEQWIQERELVAGSHELGQDYDHVTLLWERFKEFARDTEAIGSERVEAVNGIADSLIATGHSDAATIAEWKDGLNEMLVASRELHKFFHDCKDVLGRILEKQNAMSDELGRDAGSSQVTQIEEESAKLQASYAGDKAREITNREAEVVAAWNNLQSLCEGRRTKLEDTGDLFRFFNMVRTLMIWMDDVSLKAEIDAREDNLMACINLGKDLLARNHYASAQIKEKLAALTDHRNALLHRWEERWENLQLILEVYQFARDAAVAEAWLIAQEPYLMSQELGHTIDEVENLIKKHEAFEKSAAAQEERFSALHRLTTFELKELKRREQEREEEERRKKEEAAAAEAARLAKATPVTSPDEPPSERAETDGATSGERAGEDEGHEQRSPSDDEFEGPLQRKHEWESTTKKASNRSWDKVYMVVRGQNLCVYKDQKSYKASPDQSYKGEAPLDLRGATITVASDYTKKKHVFRVKSQSGSDFLFQAKDDTEMNDWVSVLNQAAQGTSGASTSRAHTLPAPTQAETKRRSFFTLKKK
ncbi:spectrin beta chain isoform x6 [Lasius niger]|uniref:Spectrin beta chain, non-erythrocytic 2 n=1 Tax=Lasius niger TaxID=67767 RepID=A0A0J7P0T6_LASNI|nr:spectrin beta chain isoform x6 [Lasius niger]